MHVIAAVDDEAQVAEALPRLRGATMLMTDGHSTTTDPACSPVQSGSTPTQGSGSALPSAPTSRDPPTVTLPPSETDTTVMSKAPCSGTSSR
jgi:hypothetical protein